MTFRKFYAISRWVTGIGFFFLSATYVYSITLQYKILAQNERLQQGQVKLNEQDEKLIIVYKKRINQLEDKLYKCQNK